MENNDVLEDKKKTAWKNMPGAQAPKFHHLESSKFPRLKAPLQ